MEFIKKNSGFTLIEMIIVIIILLILTPIATSVLIQQFQIFTAGQELLDADWQGRVALNRMVRDIRNTSQITDAQQNQISFINEQGDTVTYHLVDNKLTHTKNTSSALADNIQSLILKYYNNNDTEFTQPIDPGDLDNIRYITITLNVLNRISSIRKYADFNITNAVYLWNIKNF